MKNFTLFAEKNSSNEKTLTLQRRDILMTNSIQSFVHGLDSTISNKETFLNNFETHYSELLGKIQSCYHYVCSNEKHILKNCFLVTRS